MNSIIFYGLILFCESINCNNKSSQNNWKDLMKFSQLNKHNYFETQSIF